MLFALVVKEQEKLIKPTLKSLGIVIVTAVLLLKDMGKIILE